MAQVFRPRAWSIIGMLLIGGLLVWLGLWQLERGQSKHALEAAFQDTGTVQMLDVNTPPPDELAAPRAQARGRYDAAHQILLDNQTRDRQPGYRVWTPLLLPGGGWLMVDRGWLPASADRRELPDLRLQTADVEVSGYWRPLPRPGLRLAGESCEGGSFPRVLNYPRRELLSCVLGAPVADGLLLLDATAPQGYRRDWELPNPIPPARHYAYAAQWFAFAAVLLFFFVKLNLRRLP